MNTLLKVNGNGKNVKIIDSDSMAMLKIWAMQNTNGKSKCYIADETRKVVMIVSGNQDNLPTINKNPDEMYLEDKEG